MKPRRTAAVQLALLLTAGYALVSCGSDATTTATATYSVGVAVTGLSGTGLVLQDDGGSPLTIATNGSFTFATALATGTTYNVTVLTQPSSPAQTCAATNDSGTVAAKNVTNLTVACTTLVEFLYGTNGAGGVSAFSINTATGALTAITGSPFATEAPGVMGGWISADTAGNLVYGGAAGSNIQAWSVNRLTGALSPVSGAPLPGSPAGALAISSNGNFAYAPNETASPVSAFSIEASGVLSAKSGSPFAGGSTTAPVCVAVTPNGFFVYVANEGLDSTASTISGFSLDSVVGALSPLSGSPFASSDTISFELSQIAISPNGQFLYVSAGTGSGIAAYTINSSTGALTAVAGSPFASAANPTAITFGPGGRFLFVGNAQINGGGTGGVSAYTINSATGALTPVTGSPFSSGTSVTGVVVDVSGQFLYSANHGPTGSTTAGIGGYAINQTTGALTQITGSPFGTTTLAASVLYSLAILK